VKPLPAIVISGFLGAGKTTLLNRLLADGLGRRKTGLIVNDFGKLNVDRHLVQSGKYPVVELSNGCVCCSLQLGLAEAVRRLAARELDMLLIEASGISVSSAILNILGLPELAEAVRVSRMVAVVDARRDHVLQALPAIRDQIACANLIVLNHCDEVDAATRDAAMERLREANPGAQIIATEHGRVSMEQMLSGTPATKTIEHPAGHDQHWHAYQVVVSDDVDLNHLVAVLNRLPTSVERVKGFVPRNGRLHIVQKVGRFPATVERAPAGPAEMNALVIIARQPIETELKQIFPRCTIATE
jgi:G3E family GTPase